MGKKVYENKWRFERKFALSPMEFLQFEKQLLLSDLDVLYPDRKINNCYLDDVRYNSYNESIEGLAEKMKLRIRWYGELFSETQPNLEFKIKQNNSNRKETFKLGNVVFDASFNWFDYVNNLREELLIKHKFNLGDQFFPVLINSYERSYYGNFDHTFRLTVDRNLTFMSPEHTLGKWNSHLVEKRIVELKFHNSQILTDFPLLSNLGKFSKYTTGILLNR